MGVEYWVVSPKHKRLLDLGKWGCAIMANSPKQFAYESDLMEELREAACEYWETLWDVSRFDIDSIEGAQLDRADQCADECAWRLAHGGTLEMEPEWMRPDRILEGDVWPWTNVREWYERYKDDPHLFIVNDCGDHCLLWLRPLEERHKHPKGFHSSEAELKDGWVKESIYEER